MKQKIVLYVHMRCGKCRKEAMKIAASTDGVISVALQGSYKDQLVVVGMDVDSAGLCTALRKKAGSAILVSVEEVKDPKPDEKKTKVDPPKKPEEEKKQEKKAESKKPESSTPPGGGGGCCTAGMYYYPPPCPPPPPPQYHCDQNPQYYMCTTLPPDQNQCTIM